MVDAVSSGRPPGTIHRLNHAEVVLLDAGATSVHHLGLGACLRWLLHATPEMGRVRFRLWGIEVAAVRPHPKLSADVAAAVAAVADEIRNAVESLPLEPPTLDRSRG